LRFGLGLFGALVTVFVPTAFALLMPFHMMTMASPMMMMPDGNAQTSGGNERDCHAQDPFGSSVHVDSVILGDV
jgi:hypothetical protein